MRRGRPRPAGRREPDADGRKTAILDAAQMAFTEKGYYGAGIREIAEAAGVAKATVFHHFSTKENLLAALILDRFGGYGARYHEMASRPLNARQKIEKLARIDKWVTPEFIDFRRMLVTVRRSLSGEAREGLEALLREAYLELRGLIAGVFSTFLASDRPAGLDPQALAATFLACMDGVLVSIEMGLDPEMRVPAAETLSALFVDHLERIAAASTDEKERGLR